jgi:hypothetical protein
VSSPKKPWRSICVNVDLADYAASRIRTSV